MERNLDDRAYALAVYMLEHNATVRAAAARFGVSKSTVHMEVTFTRDSYGSLIEWGKRAGAAASALLILICCRDFCGRTA